MTSSPLRRMNCPTVADPGMVFVKSALTPLSVTVVILIVLLSARSAPAAPQTYDPLVLPPHGPVQMLANTVSDTSRQRTIPLRIYLPSTPGAAPVVLFSHGLGGSGREYAYLGEHWAARGYVAVFLQHPGSDTSVWENKPAGERFAALQKAASLQNFLLRVKDVVTVLDRLEALNKADGGPLSGRLDLKRVGMSGHSFGAITTQAVSGQSTGHAAISFTDARIKAAIVMSPSSPKNVDPKVAFGAVRIPWMLMTGTRDIAPVGDADMVSRLAVFPALPEGDKYEVVFNGAEHSAFTDRPLPGGTGKRNPNHHRASLALTTAFWDAYLRNDPAALAWLNADSPRSIMEKEDHWQRK